MARIELPVGEGTEVSRALSLVRPELAEAIGRYDREITRSRLDRRVHELARMRIAQLNQCTVCMAWRTPKTMEVLSEDTLTSVADYALRDDISPAEKAAVEFAERFATDSTSIDDELLARLGRWFTESEIVELTLIVGKYIALGRFMQVLGLDQACFVQEAHEAVRAAL